LVVRRQREFIVEKPRSYSEWRTDQNGRWRDAFHTFGHLLLSHAKYEALSKLPETSSMESKEIADKAVTDALYNLMMILEGVVGTTIGDDQSIEFSLVAKIRNSRDEIVEQFELAPNGEEPACMGFHSWTSGSFRD